MGELGLSILEKGYGRVDTQKQGSLDKLQFVQVGIHWCLNMPIHWNWRSCFRAHRVLLGSHPNSLYQCASLASCDQVMTLFVEPVWC